MEGTRTLLAVVGTISNKHDFYIGGGFETDMSLEAGTLMECEEALPVLQQLQTWLEKTSVQVPPEIAIRKADNHTLKYWSELSRYSENGEWSIDKNVAENAIRPFVIVRKAWLFGNSQRSAKASAALYSLIETVKANQQEPLS